MISVYVCPACGALRIVSRRKEADCLSCGEPMVLSGLSFLEWSEMTEEERAEYGKQWKQSKKA